MVLLPIVAVIVAVALTRSEPDPQARPRLVLGSSMIALPAPWACGTYGPGPRRRRPAGSTRPGSSDSRSAVRCQTV